jgi:toxin ParE1/3/4
VKKPALTAQAQADLRALTRSGAERWGEDQALAYARAILDKIALIGRRPALGPRVGDELPDLRRTRSGRHIIYYRQLDDLVIVSRILHDSMDQDAQEK